MPQRLLKYTLSALLAVLAFDSVAQKKLEPLSLTAQTEPVLALSKDGVGQMHYKLTNHSNKTYHLTMNAIPGVIQDSSQEQSCDPELISLKPQQSCLLHLQVMANEIIDVHPISPKLCEELIESHQENPLCIEPQAPEHIRINTINKDQASISVKVNLPSPTKTQSLIAESLGRCFSSFDLCTLTLFQGSGLSGNLVITNTSNSVTILNLMAYGLPSGVTQDASACTSIAPGETCTLYFTPGNITNLGTAISIYGSNTPKSYVTVEVLGVGDSYNGNPLFQLPTAGNPTVYTTAVSDSFPNPESWDLALNACTSPSILPTLQQLLQLYNVSNCNNGPIGGFTCTDINPPFYWSSDSTSDSVLGVDFSNGSTAERMASGLGYSRCITGYNLVYSMKP